MTTQSSSLAITWLGHGTFLLESPGGRRILLDPFLTDNPACPEQYRRSVGPLDAMLITHGHGDHVSDALRIGRETEAPVVGSYEVCAWLEQKGLKNLVGMNIGGTTTVAGVRITMVQAIHGSGFVEDNRIVYLGLAAGFVLRFEDGLVAYFAGDTDVFGDMRLIAQLYEPQLAFLPIGDHYTMGPRQAALACELLGVKQVVPMHYGTFPVLTGTPAALRKLVEPKGVQVLELEPGRTAR
ncbi:MAG: metal-dependent hydrolase [Luteitalea sp.]|nr:metal-dependent hydrolase [Luteitalea sp.]